MTPACGSPTVNGGMRLTLTAAYSHMSPISDDHVMFNLIKLSRLLILSLSIYNGIVSLFCLARYWLAACHVNSALSWLPRSNSQQVNLADKPLIEHLHRKPRIHIQPFWICFIKRQNHCYRQWNMYLRLKMFVNIALKMSVLFSYSIKSHMT